MIEPSGHAVEIRESGEGIPILFVPGSYSTSVAWRALQSCLPAGYRFIGTSLCGYGETRETRSFGDLGIEHEAAVVETVAGRIGVPVHLVGHSFGGTVALAAALRGHIDVLSLTTFEANPLNLMRERGDLDLYASVRQMSDAFEHAQAYGERDAAGRIIDFWGGDGSFSGLPDAVQDYCRQTVQANVLDWHTAFGFELTRAHLARLDIPVLLVRGALANPAMVLITEALNDGLPNARMDVVAGASHFLISTHARECANLLSGFLAANAS